MYIYNTLMDDQFHRLMSPLEINVLGVKSHRHKSEGFKRWTNSIV